MAHNTNNTHTHNTGACFGGHNLLALWIEQRYSDLTLRFVATDGSELCQLRTHKSVLHASQVPYFQALINEHHNSVTIHLQQPELTARHMRTLLQLLYLPQLGAETLGSLAQELAQDWLCYYELALYLTYDALLHWLLQQLAQSLTAAAAHTLLGFCHATNNYGPLYRLLAQWSHYCQQPLPGLPTPTANTLTPVPPKRLSPQHVVYYRSTCHECLHATQTQAFGHWAIDLGGLQCGDLCCDFALWRPPKGSLSLMMRLGHQRGDDDMSVEEGTPLLAHTRLRQFSRLYDAPALETRRSLAPSVYTELAQFDVHRHACYEGQCGACNRQTQPLYILHIEVDLSLVTLSNKSNEVSS